MVTVNSTNNTPIRTRPLNTPANEGNGMRLTISKPQMTMMGMSQVAGSASFRMVMSETTASASVAPAEEMVSPAESPRPLAFGGSKLKRANRYAPASTNKTAKTPMKKVEEMPAR